MIGTNRWTKEEIERDKMSRIEEVLKSAAVMRYSIAVNKETDNSRIFDRRYFVPTIHVYLLLEELIIRNPCTLQKTFFTYTIFQKQAVKKSLPLFPVKV